MREIVEPAAVRDHGAAERAFFEQFKRVADTEIAKVFVRCAAADRLKAAQEGGAGEKRGAVRSPSGSWREERSEIGIPWDPLEIIIHEK